MTVRSFKNRRRRVGTDPPMRATWLTAQVITPLSFTKILKCNLDPLVVHLLEVVSELLSALGTAREELDDVSNWRAALDRFDPGSRPYIDEAVEIVIDHVVEQGVDIDPARRFIADAQHLGTIAYGRDVLIAPTSVLQPNAADRCTLTFEPHALGLCAVSGEILGKRHLHGSHQVDGLSHVLAFSSVRGSKHGAKKQGGNDESVSWLEHLGTPEKNLRTYGANKSRLALGRSRAHG